MACQPLAPRVNGRSLAFILCICFVAIGQSLAATYPNCPFTGLPPQKPKVPHTRCLSANEYSCCEDCADIGYGLTVVSANVSTIICNLPGLSQICSLIKNTPGDLQLCSVFVGTEQCLNYLEQMVCAVSCNPDGGNFVKNGTSKEYMYELNICSDFAEAAYSACKNLKIPGFAGTLALVLPSARVFLSSIFGGLASALNQYTYNVTIVNGTDLCFNGDLNTKNETVCCDPLTVPSSCPAGAVNFTANPDWKQYSGRKVDPKVCSDNVAPAPGPAEPLVPGPPGNPAGTPTQTRSPPSSSVPAPPSAPTPPPPKSGSKSVVSVILALIGGAAWMLSLGF